LALFVTKIRANNAHHAFPAHNLALLANPFN